MPEPGDRIVWYSHLVRHLTPDTAIWVHRGRVPPKTGVVVRAVTLTNGVREPEGYRPTVSWQALLCREDTDSGPVAWDLVSPESTRNLD